MDPGGSDTQVQYNDGGVFGGSSAFTFNKTTGRVAVGLSNAFTLNTIPITTGFTVQSNSFSGFDQQTFSNTAGNGSTSYYLRARGTDSGLLAVQNGDIIGQHIVAGYDGTDYATGGYMLWTVDGTPGNNDMPTSWSLYLTPDGSASAVNAVTIASTRVSTWKSTMNVVPDTDINALTLRPFGTSTSIKTLDILDSSGNSWCYVRKRLLSDTEAGFEMNFTSSGTTGAFRNGFSIAVAAGYTGSGFTGVLNFDNLMAGTNTSYTADSTLYSYRLSGNRGIGGYCRAVTVGHNVGVLALAGNGAVNYAMWGASTVTKASAVNVGLFGCAYNATATSPAYIGVYATCYNSAGVPPNMAGITTPFLADNQSFAIPIAIFRNNGTSQVSIEDAGDLLLGDRLSTTNLGTRFRIPTTVQTTDATVTTLESFTTASDTAYTIHATVSAVKSDGSQVASYVMYATFQNDSGTLTQVGTTSYSHTAESDAAWDAVLDISGTAVRVRITGVAATTIRWQNHFRISAVKN